jgi:hypothetical protein
VPIVAIPDWWWYTAWYDMLELSAVASAADGFYLAGYLLHQAKEAGRNRVLAAGAPAGPHRFVPDPARLARLTAAERPTS